MQPRVLRTLEYNKVIEQLKQHASSSLGIEKIENLTPSTDLSEIKKSQDITDEGVTVLRLKGDIPFGGIRDIRGSLKRSKIGGMLHENELLEIADTIRGSRQLKLFIEKMVDVGTKLPILSAITEQIEPETGLERAITDSIDDHGIVRDSASEALRRVRSQLRTLDQRLKERLESIVRSSQYQKMLSEGIITIRNERYVVPVKQEYRGAFQGIVHDQSSSGQTLFIEPQAVVNINNDLNEARAKERHEVEKILRALTEQTAVVSDPLLFHLSLLAELDFTFAKARYSNILRATKPRLNNNGNIVMKKARHPLIPKEQVVPIDITLGDGYQSMIITGPNTGGKTVTLKTMGLLTLMAQSGLQIPAQEEAEVNIFSSIFADIGDEQSIEQNLSTFSSHMTNIVSILSKLDRQSLVLFDELGAGTDPQEGAALAIAILDEVYSRGASVIATTHYSELKTYAYDREGVINASVEFNVETLRPTYRLLIGVPGRSNAFEISKRLGLPNNIIDHAREHISHETNKIDAMIASLESSKKQAEVAESETERLRKEAEGIHQELSKQLERFEIEKLKAMKEAEEKAKEAVAKAKKEAEEIVNDLRKIQKRHQADVKDHELIDAKKRLEEVMTPLSTSANKKVTSVQSQKVTFDVGQEVKAVKFGQKGHIVEQLNNDEYLVQIGILKVNVKTSDLKVVKSEEQVKPVVNVRTASTGHVKTELDLRGERYEDAMRKVESYLDSALMAGYHQVSIIHGKGTGALRKGVQNLLKSHSHVKNTRFGEAGEGGNGVTVVELK